MLNDATSRVAEESEGPEEAFRATLAASGLLVPTAARGIAGTSMRFERIVEGLQRRISATGLDPDRPRTRLRFPPVLSRRLIERLKYVAAFPQLVGSIQCFPHTGDYRHVLAATASGGDWSETFENTDLVLTPAACHPVYELVAGRRLGEREVLEYDVMSHCYRNELTSEVTRMRSFRMHELVTIGSASGLAHQEAGLSAAVGLIESLGLDPQVETASDPFFGPGAGVLRARQMSKLTKLELVVEINELPVAVASANSHGDFFAELFGIVIDESGEFAATTCVAFGLERLALALLWRHGVAVESWPDHVLAALDLTS